MLSADIAKFPTSETARAESHPMIAVLAFPNCVPTSTPSTRALRRRSSVSPLWNASKASAAWVTMAEASQTPGAITRTRMVSVTRNAATRGGSQRRRDRKIGRTTTWIMSAPRSPDMKGRSPRPMTTAATMRMCRRAGDAGCSISGSRPCAVENSVVMVARIRARCQRRCFRGQSSRRATQWRRGILVRQAGSPGMTSRELLASPTAGGSSARPAQPTPGRPLPLLECALPQGPFSGLPNDHDGRMS
jgi:hypothetical protein